MNDSVKDVLEGIMHRLNELSKYRGHKGQVNLRIVQEMNILQEVMIRLDCKDHEWYSEESPRPRYRGGGRSKKNSRRTYEYE